MFSTHANAPAAGEGVGVQLAGRNIETLTEKQAQTQVLSSRIGVSEPVAALLLSLIRGEPYHAA